MSLLTVSVTRVLNKSLRAAQSSVFASTWVGADNVYVSPDGSHAAFAWGAAGKEIAVAAAGSLAALNKDSPGMREKKIAFIVSSRLCLCAVRAESLWRLTSSLPFIFMTSEFCRCLK